MSRTRRQSNTDRFDHSTILESAEDLDRMCRKFDVNDDDEIAEILNGSISMDVEL
jgi:hypothetical protein